jgi:hypothetical protein
VPLCYCRHCKKDLPAASGDYLVILKICAKPTIFFSNPKVKSLALLKPHYEKTSERIRSSSASYILAIQDSTFFNYTTHKAKTMLGRIGSTRHRQLYGLIQHTTLCVTEQNEVLGLLDMQLFHHEDQQTSLPKEQRAAIDKQSYRWRQALENMKKRLGDAQKRLVTVADREGDFFEFLRQLQAEQELFVIRAKYDRHTGKKYRQRGEKLSARMAREPTSGTMQVSYNESVTKPKRTVTLTLKCAKDVLLPPAYHGRGSIGPTDLPITVNVVMAYNEEHRWMLLTNLPVDNEEQIRQVVSIYRCRWHIECFHKVLKTAYQAEKLYLHASRQAIENALTLVAFSACRFYWLVYTGRHDQATSAAVLFERHEWESLYVYFKEEVPVTPPAVAEIVKRIARLGGHKHRPHDKPPGIKTLWHGFQLFSAIATMYQAMLSTKT